MRRILLLLILEVGLFGATSGLHATPSVRQTNREPLSLRSAAPCDQGPANPPDAARTNLEQVAADWGVFCEGSASWRLENVLQPVPEDSALRCMLTGGQPYANIHCYRNLLPDAAARRFTLSMTFEYSPTTSFNSDDSVVQALEFSLSKWQGGQRNEWALQWRNVGAQAPGWRYWDPFATPDQWVSLGITRTAIVRLTGKTRHTLALTGEIIANRSYYRDFTLDGHTHHLTQVAEPQPDSAHADGLAVAVQLDGNAMATPYELIIDKVDLTATSQYHVFVPIMYFPNWPPCPIPLICVAKNAVHDVF